MVCVSELSQHRCGLTSLRKGADHEQTKKVVQAFNTWAFKREQPSTPGLLTRFVHRAILRDEPLSFVLYWGKGPRSHVERPDLDCLDFLASMAQRVQNAYCHGAAISLVLTDTHAELNGHSAESIAHYFTAIDNEARKREFECFLLSDLTAAAPDLQVVDCPQPSQETLSGLVESAMKWYRGAGTPEDGARRYYLMNMTERRVIQTFFPTSIFVTFNGREVRELFPESLPIFYMYSLKRGTSVKPWFLFDAAPGPALMSA
jgi:hypothetical protein